MKKKMLVKTLAITLILALSLALVGCGDTSQPTVDPQQTPGTAPGSQTPAPVPPSGSEAPPPPTPEEERSVTITDMSGDTVTITGEVKRIINLWPAGTSSFFALNAGDLIVGLGSVGSLNEWVKLFYPDAVNIADLGGTSPTVEELINLDPDLVIIHPSTAASGFAQQIRDIGIPAININFSDYETMNQAYTVLGEILGGVYQEKLSAWTAATEAKIANARNLTSGLSEDERPVLFYIAGQSNSMTTTMPADSIFSSWAESAGAIYGSRLLDLAAGNEVTPEAVFALNPDMIIVGGVWQHVIKNDIETMAGWRDLSATANGRIYTNPYACFNWDRFGLESQLQINYALLCIQPEIAAANGISRESIIGDILDFYKTYTDFELTRQQAEFMLDGLAPDGTAENPVQ